MQLIFHLFVQKHILNTCQVLQITIHWFKSRFINHLFPRHCRATVRKHSFLWACHSSIAPWNCVSVNNESFGSITSFKRLITGSDLSPFDLEGHSACRWYGSSCSVCIPSLKFVGLPVREIWRTSGLSISRPDDLHLWSLTLNLGRIIARGVDNLPTNFGLPGTFRFRLIGQHLSAASHNLATLTFDLCGSLRLSLMRVFVLCLCTKFEVRRSSRSEDITHFRSQH